MTMSRAINRRTALGSLAATLIARPELSAAQGATPKITTIDSDFSYPEGVLLDNGKLYVADILREQIVVFDSARLQRENVISLTSCGPTAIAPFVSDQIVVDCHMTAHLAILTKSGELKQNIVSTINNRPIPWPNDSTSDGDGGVFITSSGVFDPNAPATGAVMHVSRTSQVTVMAERFHYANGITYDPVKRELFVTEHFANKVWLFVLDEVFSIRERRVFFDLSPLPAPNVPPFFGIGPDNLHFRANGDLIVPNYGGGRFLIVSRTGELKQIVDVPTQFITDAVELDGDILFIGSFELSSPHPKGILGRVHMA
jgi:sugar lactone lactonase YvrE